MSSIVTNAVSAAAIVCSTSSFVPQLVKILRERQCEDVSLRMSLVTVIGFRLWTAYGLLAGLWPVIVSNLICLGLSSAILVLKLRFSRSENKRAAGDDPAAPAVQRSIAD